MGLNAGKDFFFAILDVYAGQKSFKVRRSEFRLLKDLLFLKNYGRLEKKKKIHFPRIRSHGYDK